MGINPVKDKEVVGAEIWKGDPVTGAVNAEFVETSTEYVMGDAVPPAGAVQLRLNELAVTSVLVTAVALAGQVVTVAVKGATVLYTGPEHNVLL